MRIEIKKFADKIHGMFRSVQVPIEQAFKNMPVNEDIHFSVGDKYIMKDYCIYVKINIDDNAEVTCLL